MEGSEDFTENPPSESSTETQESTIQAPKDDYEGGEETPVKIVEPPVKIVARPSPEDEYIPSVSSPMKRNGSLVNPSGSPGYTSGSPKSSPRAKPSVNFDASKVQIDTTAPFESVKEAVSKFGGIVDWKAHREQTMERRKLMEQELEKAQEEIPSYKKQSEAAEEAKTQVLKELDGTKRLIEELKLNLERAQKEEEQAKQDAELANLRVEELQQGIADEASFAAKAQLEVARARHTAAVTELKNVREEMEHTKKNYAKLASERDDAVRKAEEAVSSLKEVEKTVEDLTIELITAKESLESAHGAHMEAEEHRIGAVMAKEQDVLQWAKELKDAEEELKKLTQQMARSRELKEELDRATAIFEGLKSEMASYMESKIDELTYAEANKELEETKAKIEKAAEEVNILRVASSSLKAELEKEKSELSAIQQREGMASIAVSSLEAELGRTKDEIALFKAKEKEEKEKMVELPGKLQEAAREADRAKAVLGEAKERLSKAREESDQSRAAANTVESRLHAVLKEIEAAKASEKLALAAVNALKESESFEEEKEGEERVTLSLEEYYELSKKAHEAEEQANLRIAEALSRVELAKESELKSLNELEEAKGEASKRRETLESALQRAERAKEGKLGAEQDLRVWRAENERRRKAGKNESVQENRSSKASFEDGSEAKKSVGTADSSSPLYEKSSPNSSIVGVEDSPQLSRLGTKTAAKKKKRSFFLRIFMSLSSRKKSQTYKTA